MQTTLTITSELPQKKGLFILILILLSTAGLIGSDVYLPTLPTIGVVLNQNPQKIQ